VFLLENVPALLGRHRWVLDRLLSLLASSDMPTYEWYWDVVCPTEFGGVFSRPRLFLLLRAPRGIHHL
jgi:site-specific DNA-cytosine methylase